MSMTQEDTYEKRLGYVVDGIAPPEHPGVEINCVRWATIGDRLAVFPDVFDGGDRMRTLPHGVSVAMSTYDNMVVLR